LIQLFKEFGNVADMMGYNAYLVGGIVRDVILKRENLDVDIVIEGDGIKFAHEYAAHHEVKVRSHKKFGTVVLVFPDGFKVDIATARIEYYDSPAAPPTVETSSLKMDLYRRDFTINTLAVKLNKRDYGTLVDYFGAQKDIREKVIRVLHNLSFVEDPTRVLRAIRFEQRFGLKIGKLTLALMKNAVAINCFKDLSGRRLFLEIKLLLMEREPLKAIERMNEFGLLQVISPALNLTRDLRNLLQNVQGVISWFDLLYLDEPYEPWKVYWHALTSTLDKRALNQVSKRMQLGEKEKQILIDQQLEANKAIEKLYRIKGAKNYQLYTLLSRYDTEILLWLMAKANNPTIKKQISTYFTKLKNSESILKGKDLKKIGFEPGPLYKKIFDSLLEARINNQVSTKQDEIRFVKEKFSEHLKTAA
ncbi:MAG: CCA tRNA nucleotidyltransferase, partial [Deltaproteobacteria bacterium]|nr:CCA tRNA nucleotidyltransferase [Deltaproteobacteria bacterium]